MPAAEKILWRYCPTDELKLGNSGESRVDLIGRGSLMHENIGTLIIYLGRDKRDWNLQKVITDTDKVSALPDARNGWYEANCDIPSNEGLISIVDARKMYFGH